MPKVSVCVPIYNVEKYIEKCVRSLFEQTLDDIEYIFVNDCTPDKSMDILRRVLVEYPQRQERVKIIDHKVNKGSATVRNTCLSAATGEYIGWCDSDDWVETDMYEAMYDKAKAENADVVWCNYDTTKDPVICSPKTELFLQSADYLKLLCLGEYAAFNWNKLVKREIYSDYDIRFPDNNDMMEDVVATFQVMHFAKKVVNIPRVLYHYVQNGCSITSRPKVHDMIVNISMVSDYFTEWYAGDPEMMKYLYWLQPRCKFEMFSFGQIPISAFNSLWRHSLWRKILLSNPTIRWYNKIVYWELSCGGSFFLKIKRILKNWKTK